MMAQSRAENTWEIYNYGRFINQFLPNTIKSIQQYERINKKYVDKKCLLYSLKFVLMKKCCWNIHIYIYCQTDCFVVLQIFSVARQARFPKLGWKPGWLKDQSEILPLSHKETSASKGNLNAYVSHLFLFTYICLTATESSIHLKSLALRYSNHYFLC